MECLACLACVDACDAVMAKLGRPRGLIGLFSQRALAGGGTRLLRPRLALYGALFLLTTGVLGASLLARTPFEANVLRPRGANPFVLDGDRVRNVFEIHLVNKAPAPASFRIEVSAPVAAEIVVAQPEVSLGSLEGTRVPITVAIERAALAGPVELEAVVTETASGETLRRVVRFLAPAGGGR